MGDSVSTSQDASESESQNNALRPLSPVVGVLQVTNGVENLGMDIVRDKGNSPDHEGDVFEEERDHLNEKKDIDEITFPGNFADDKNDERQKNVINKNEKDTKTGKDEQITIFNPTPSQWPKGFGTKQGTISELSDLEQEVTNSAGKGLRVELINKKLMGTKDMNKNGMTGLVSEASSKRQFSPDTFAPSPTLLSFAKYSSSDDFERLRLIGSGSFAKIYSCKDIRDNKLYAMKVIERSNVCTSKAIEHMHAEVSIIKNANHPFIVKYHADFVTDSSIVLVTSLAAGGDLFNHLYGYQQATSNGILPISPFSLTQIRLWVLEIALALQALHNWGAVYRDLKPENVLVMADGHLSLTDFGMCKIFNKNRLLIASEVSPINEGYNIDKYSDNIYGYGLSLNGNPVQDQSLRTLQLPNSSYNPMYKKNKTYTSIVSNMNRFLELNIGGKGDYKAQENYGAESSDVVKDTLGSKMSPGSDSGTLNAKTLCGTLCYMAPELVTGMRPTPLSNRNLANGNTLSENGKRTQNSQQGPPGHGRGVDWWALGVLTYELITGYNPFKFDGKHSVATQILSEDVLLPQKRITVKRKMGNGNLIPLSYPTTRNLVTVEEEIPKAFQDFVNSLLIRDRHKRLGSLGKSSEVVRHPLFDGLDLNKVLKKEYSSQYKPVKSQKVCKKYHTEDVVSLKLPEILSNYTIIGVMSDDGDAVGISAAGTTDTCITLDDSTYSHNLDNRTKGEACKRPTFSDTLQNTIGGTSDYYTNIMEQNNASIILKPTINMQNFGYSSGAIGNYSYYPKKHKEDSEIIDIINDTSQYSTSETNQQDRLFDTPEEIGKKGLSCHHKCNKQIIDGNFHKQNQNTKYPEEQTNNSYGGKNKNNNLANGRICGADMNIIDNNYENSPNQSKVMMKSCSEIGESSVNQRNFIIDDRSWYYQQTTGNCDNDVEEEIVVDVDENNIDNNSSNNNKDKTNNIVNDSKNNHCTNCYISKLGNEKILFDYRRNGGGSETADDCTEEEEIEEYVEVEEEEEEEEEEMMSEDDINIGYMNSPGDIDRGIEKRTVNNGNSQYIYYRIHTKVINSDEEVDYNTSISYEWSTSASY